MCKTGKQIITFGNTEVEKHKFRTTQKPNLNEYMEYML